MPDKDMSRKNSSGCCDTNSAGQGRSGMPTGRDILIYAVIVCAGVGADLWSKAAIFRYLESRPGDEVVVIGGFFNLVRRLNSGAAFSIAQNMTAVLIIVSIIALIAVVMFFLLGRVRSRLMQAALGLFTAGIIGNLFDRIFNDGMVRDFLDVYYRSYHWPAFNIADSMLCTAVVLILVHNLTCPASQRHTDRQKGPHQGLRQGQ